MPTRKHRPDGAIDATIRFLYVERRLGDREIAEALTTQRAPGESEWTRVDVTKRRLAMGVTRADRPSAASLG